MIKKSLYKNFYIYFILVLLVLFGIFSCEKEKPLILKPIPALQIYLETSQLKFAYPDTFKVKINIEVIEGKDITDSISFVKDEEYNVHKANANIEIPINKDLIVRLYTTLNGIDFSAHSDTLRVDTATGQIRALRLSLTSGGVIINSPKIENIINMQADVSSALFDNGGEAILSKGFILKDTFPEDGFATILDTIEVEGNNLGVFSASIDLPEYEKNYCIYAFVENNKGAFLSQPNCFKLEEPTNTVQLYTYEATYISDTSAELRAELISNGGNELQEYGFIWSTTPNVSINNYQNRAITDLEFGATDFYATMESLSPATTYFVKSYVSTNNSEIFYGNEITFTTISAMPTVETTGSSDVFIRTAKISGRILSTGAGTITEKGVIYSDSYIFDYTNNMGKFISNSLNANFNVEISGLEKNNWYYAKAYAINSEGSIGYGEVIEIETLGVGDNGPAGGTIFFVDNNNIGFEVAPLDYLAENQQWGCSELDISGTELEVGKGADNTILIINTHNAQMPNYETNPDTECSPDHDGTIAAKYCAEVEINGYSDWFLPSYNELQECYNYFQTADPTTITMLQYTWTSTQAGDDFMYAYMLTQSLSTVLKNTSGKAIPIRKF